MPLRRRHRLAQEVEAPRRPGSPRGAGSRGTGPRAARSSVGSGGDVLAGEEDPAGGDLVDGVAEQRVGQRRLPGAVRAHQGVELARADGQGDAVEDLAAVDGDVEIVDLEGGSGGGGDRGHGRHCNNTTDVVEIPGPTFHEATVRVDGLVAADHGRGREALLDPGPAGRGVELVDEADRVRRGRRRCRGGSRDAVVDELGRGAPVRRDDRRAARHGLDHHEAERLGPPDREQHARGPGRAGRPSRRASRSRTARRRGRAAGSISCSKYASSGGSPRFRIILQRAGRRCRAMRIASTGPLSGFARPM